MRDYSEMYAIRDDYLQLLRTTFGVMIGADYKTMEASLIAGMYYERGDLLSALYHALTALRSCGQHTHPEPLFCANMILQTVLYAIDAFTEAEKIMELKGMTINMFYFDAKQVKEQIIKWIADYFQNNASPAAKAVVGISGGKDSSVVAALCAKALGKSRVLGVLMPQGEQHDIDIALELCRVLDIEHITINIKDSVQALYDKITEAGLVLNNAAAFNTPARLRMATLYAVSAIVGGRVANTSNLSEDWVGYATKFGDASGDFSPLSNLTVTETKAIGRELELPAKFIEKVPIDGLCGKTDEDNLGFSYDVLDKYIRCGVCDDAAVKSRIDTLHKMNLHKMNPMPAFHA